MTRLSFSLDIRIFFNYTVCDKVVIWEVDSIPTQTFFNLDEDKKERILQAAVDEFAVNSYEHAKLSNIIRNANIPRGSLYQYFEDKFDLINYIFEIVKQKKIDYMKDLLANPEDKPFLVLFRELFTAGANFAMENPKYVQVVTNELSSSSKVFERILKDGIQLANEYYVSYIKADQAKGRIREDIDPAVFASMVTDLTMNVTIEKLVPGQKEIDYDDIIERINQIIKIIEHGVMKGERNV